MKGGYFMPVFAIEASLPAFASHLRQEGRSAATVEKYRCEVRRFAFWLADRPLDREAVRTYREALAAERTAAGVNGAAAALNRLFAFLGHRECRMRSVRVQRQIFRDENRELTQAEYRRLLAAAGRRNQRLLLVMQAICATGIRVGELRFFTVAAVAAGRVEVSGKGKVRTVLLPRKLQRLLLQYARRRGISGGPVFVTRTGRPLDRSNIWHEMKGLCREAGVAETKVFPHNLRHLFARTYYSMEKDIVRLADILGHSSVNTTRIYTMESGDTHRRQLERMRLLL